ncbi:MAG TPA: hypothetical protein VL128_08790 [Candidatus Eisenbacteria bacterium]|nr:hypothetical protein [Candidatus Eisenbacteria bacterium]
MIRRIPWVLFLTCCLPILAFCQGNTAPDNSPKTPPAASVPSTSSQPQATEPHKPAKVWTNEDLQSAGSISVVGDARNQKYTMTKNADPAVVARYRRDLRKLEAQLKQVNEKLRAYEEFEQGKPVSQGGRDLSHGYNRTPVDQQMAGLQEKKKQLETQMDELYEKARKDGIEAGQLE